MSSSVRSASGCCRRRCQVLSEFIWVPTDSSSRPTIPADTKAAPTQESKTPYAAVDAVRAQVDAIYEDNRKLEAALASARAEIEANRAELKELREAAVEFERAADEFREDCTSALMEQAQRAIWMPLDGLLTAFTELERAGDSSGVIEHLVIALSREFSRVALYAARGDSFLVVHHLGFERGKSPDTSIPSTSDSLITRAFTSADMQIVMMGTRSDSVEASAEKPDMAALLPFDGAPSCAVALPVAIKSAVVAVVYADDSDVPGFSTAIPHARIKFAELLRRHANLLISRATDREAVVIPFDSHSLTPRRRSV